MCVVKPDEFWDKKVTHFCFWKEKDRLGFEVSAALIFFFSLSLPPPFLSSFSPSLHSFSLALPLSFFCTCFFFSSPPLPLSVSVSLPVSLTILLSLSCTHSLLPLLFVSLSILSLSPHYFTEGLSTVHFLGFLSQLKRME